MKRLYKELFTFMCAFCILCVLIACADNNNSNTGPVYPNVETLAAEDGQGQITLTWDKPSDSTYSGVTVAYQSGQTVPASCAAATGVTITEVNGNNAVMHVVTDLAANGTYSFRVCAKYGVGEVASGVTARGNSDSSPPGEVAGVMATPAPGQVRLDWTKPSDDDYNGVTIAYQTGATAPLNCERANNVTLVQADGADAVTHIINFSRPLEYSFRVCAKDKAGNVSQGAGDTAVTGTVTQYGIGTATCNAPDSGTAELDLFFGDGTYDNCMQRTIANPDGYAAFGLIGTVGTDIYGEVPASGGAGGTSTFYRYVNNRQNANELSATFVIDSDGTVDVTGKSILVWLRSAQATTATVRLASAASPVVRSGTYTIRNITNYWQEFAIPIGSGTGSLSLETSRGTLSASAVNRIEFIPQNLFGTNWGAQQLDIDEVRIGVPSDSIRFPDSFDFDLGNNCIHVYGDDTTSCSPTAADEIASGVTVGTVRANVISTSGAPMITYTLTAGNDAGNYFINANSGILTTVRAQSGLSAGTIATLTVRASLSAELFDTVTVNITNNGAVFTPSGPAQANSAAVTLTELDSGCDSGSTKCLQISGTSVGNTASFFFDNPSLRRLSTVTVRYRASSTITTVYVALRGAGGLNSPPLNLTSTPAIVADGTWQTLTIPLSQYPTIGDTLRRVNFGVDEADAILIIDEIYIH